MRGVSAASGSLSFSLYVALAVAVVVVVAVVVANEANEENYGRGDQCNLTYPPALQLCGFSL